ncbi:glycosyltransferase family 29 protein [Sphingomonas sp. ID0503]|uniref:glycosyltransferase family 29 protein n=1 Tax=Sphingomonas sp. ID0503 TaxID=3399691 RepID=UPI003AFACDDD
MEVITPFDFRDMFAEGGSLAIIGNAPSLVGEGLGAWIDSHDVVVRFNEAALAGFEADLGSRTDILVTNPYPEGRDRPPLDGFECRMVLAIAPLTRRGDAATFVVVRFNEAALAGFEADLGSRTDILVTNPYPEGRDRPPLDGFECRMVLAIAPLTRRGDAATFRAWVGDRRVLFTYTPDPGGLASPRIGGLTTGVAAYPLLRRILRPSAITLANFTMFQGETAHSYWTEATPPGVAKHDMRSNAQALVEMINGSGKNGITVTSDLRWMAAQAGVKLSKYVQVKELTAFPPDAG